jgi:hypothetical protein
MAGVAQKLLLKPGMAVARVGGEASWFEPLPPGAGWTSDENHDGVDAALLVVVTSEDLTARLPVLKSRAARDALTWVIYPKKGTVAGSDLTRDVIWRRLRGTGVRPVTQVAVSEVWSALRTRAGDDA